jgi:hypothetical protein
MKIIRFTFSILLFVAICYCSTDAQTLTIAPLNGAGTDTKADSIIHLKFLKNPGILSLLAKDSFVKRPDYNNGKETPGSIPNAYRKENDLSTPIPTYRIVPPNAKK